MSWGDWLFLSSAIGAGVFVALLAAGTLLVGMLTGALRELNRQTREDEQARNDEWLSADGGVEVAQ